MYFCLIVFFIWRPQELEQQFERERVSLEEQKTLLLQQLEELRQELTSRLTAANQEVNIYAVSAVFNHAPGSGWQDKEPFRLIRDPK